MIVNTDASHLGIGNRILKSVFTSVILGIGDDAPFATQRDKLGFFHKNDLQRKISVISKEKAGAEKAKTDADPAALRKLLSEE